MTDRYPSRIVCLTEEPTEVLYALGQSRRIVGISGYTVRPAIARKEKPKVSAFLSAKIDEILKLQPDLVVGFSDIQADIAQALIKAGIEVWISNHRTVDGILNYVCRLGALVGATADAEFFSQQLQNHTRSISARSSEFPVRPRVYFEEWYEPQISCIKWVSELIKIAGGDDIFSDLSDQTLARDRIIHDPKIVIERNPDIIVGSWCGKKFNAQSVAAREGWQRIAAVRNSELHEIKSAIILQPGPAALSDGLDFLHALIADWVKRRGSKSQIFGVTG